MTMEVNVGDPPLEDLGDIVSNYACLYYKSLSKNGKPVNNQWTSMAAIVMFNPTNQTEKFSVVSLGTGTKCLGQKEISRNGDLLTDSHAEVVARRAFLCYLYGQLKLSIDEEKTSIFKSNGNSKEMDNLNVPILREVELKDGIQFHLFVSHVPCGDAAIFPAKPEEPSDSEPSAPKKAKFDNEPEKIQHRTGAKLQAGAKHFEEEIQELGKCRIKGGKGDPTLCMSCSDKLFKWQLMGLQGSLLGNVIKEPIRISSIVVGAFVPYNYQALQRAIYLRFQESVAGHSIFKDYPKFLDAFVCPRICQSKINFMEFENTLTPAPACIISYKLPTGESRTQVSVNGRKHGTTKKSKGKSCWLDVSRVNLFHLFRSLSLCKCSSYQECKLINSVYYNIWLGVKQDVLNGWTQKPEIMLQFEG